MTLTDYNRTYRYLTIVRSRSTIFVDYFDTLVKTIANPYHINLQLFKCILNKYTIIQGRFSLEDVSKLWENAIQVSRKTYDDAPWDVLMTYIYNNLGGSNLGVDSSVFTKYCYDTYVAIILGAQYLNKPIYKLLRRAKTKGKKIYLVSDFWLPVEAYEIFLSTLGIRELFDGLYISSSINKSKFRGTIYPYVLKSLGIDANDVVMIGDNKRSDVKHAKKHAIQPLFYLNVSNKLYHRYIKNHGELNTLKIIKKKNEILHKNTALSAYTIGFYFFCNKLYQRASKDGIKSLCFLSRDGLLLKELFDIYQNICIPPKDQIETHYVINSRIVNQKAYDGKDTYNNDYTLFKTYMSQYSHDGVLAIVDNGWKCSSQMLFSELLSCKTIGYYIGVNKKENPANPSCLRNGLIFDIDTDGKGSVSKYYNILSARCKFIYEQLLTNDKGTLESYYRDIKGDIQFKYADEPSNSLMYCKYIKQIQKDIKYNLAGMSAWLVNSNFTAQDMATMYLKLIINQTKQDCVITNEIKNHRFELYDKINGIHEYSTQSDKIKKSDLNSFNLKTAIDIIKRPEEFLSYFVGIKRRLVKHPIILPFFRIIEVSYYRFLKHRMKL